MNSTGKLVFVVDDDASVRKSLVRLFRSAGLDSEAFDSARSYLARGSHDGPSCLVLDVQMPDLTGVELQHSLLERGDREQVVFITGNGNIPMCAKAMKAGAVDFLPKPFDDSELLDAVDRALKRSEDHRRHQACQTETKARIGSLTPRELQVFERIVVGKMNKEIASELGTALKTVKCQRSRVMEKMRVSSLAELVLLAKLAGIGPVRGS